VNGFDLAFDRLIGNEGGYVNDSGDPGGETKWGISKRSYPSLDIPNLSREDAKGIYKRDFWDRIQGGNMPFAVAFQAFDFAVNSGIETAVRNLQQALDVAVDGHWGPVTQKAAALCDEAVVVLRLTSLRLVYLTSLNAWPYFGRGWARRVASNLLVAADDVRPTMEVVQ
jgi:lysozyme family protein